MSKYHRLAWDEASKQRQRERINTVKPWLKSTGAKTTKGKERSKMNALKTDPKTYALSKEFEQLMKQQKEICNAINLSSKSKDFIF